MEKKYVDLFKAIEENRLYDFIANDGYRYSKDELVVIIKELIYYHGVLDVDDIKERLGIE